ncbi:MAG: glycosyltransferase family 39 protein [Deltaproteobacteria bacterium]|nr:glycosyltransferase family 39 protein [Deltaproteobacteria bacterium]
MSQEQTAKSNTDLGLGALAVLIVGLTLGLQARWLGQDQLLRDGDEEGHVGAAELFLHDLLAGDTSSFVARLLWLDMGDYPSLYPGIVGLWWWVMGGGPPEALAVRAVNSVFLGLAGLGVAGLGRRLGLSWGAAALAGALTLSVPLNLGLSRAFMPEGALTALTALTLWAATGLRERRFLMPALGVGLGLGLAALTKQTAPLFVLPGLLALARPGPWIIWAAVGASVAAPWWVVNFEEQRAYAASSVVYEVEASALSQAFYYPRVLWESALGPLWTIIAVVAAALALRETTTRRLAVVALCWTVGGLLLLTLIPKKYDRLAAPLLPGVALVIAAAAATRPRLGLAALGLVGWSGWMSEAETPFNTPSEAERAFHPGCPQRWLRPPSPTGDLGLDAVVRAVAERPPSSLAVVGSLDIPCAVQTTFPWEQHLGPALRRAGVDVPEASPEAAGLVITLGPAGGGAGELVVPIPELEAEAALRWR